jgi:hypothetical protein
LSEVAWKNGIVIFARNVASGFVRRIVSLLPLAVTPRTCFALPELTARAPTMLVPFGSVMNCAPGEARSLLAVRSMANLKFAAVTGLPSLKRKPFRSVNVYTLPLRDTVNFDATSGFSCVPTAPALSG